MLFQGVITAIGAWLGAFLGGTDSLLYAIVAFTIIDYATGILAAINAHKLSSSVGFRGIARKILIFALIGLAHLLDVHILGTPGVLRTATIFFYLSNEGISVLENAALLGLPIPGGLQQALDTIKQTGQNQPAFKTGSTPPAKASSPDKYSPHPPGRPDQPGQISAPTRPPRRNRKTMKTCMKTILKFLALLAVLTLLTAGIWLVFAIFLSWILTPLIYLIALFILATG